MDKGYVALLDVLGFSALVAGDQSGDRLRQYLNSVIAATKGREVGYVVFSDSIVLTAKGTDPNALATLARVCSQLFFNLLTDGIPLRGAIAFGDILRTQIAENESIFVAGRAVIDAYNFERQQDWVGIMLCPSAVESVEEMVRLIELERHAMNGTARDVDMDWATFIQPCKGIPFHSDAPLQHPTFDGFAIVPTQGDLRSFKVQENVENAIERLKWLRRLAPTPSAQRKYQMTGEWLEPISKWWRAVRQIRAY